MVDKINCNVDMPIDRYLSYGKPKYYSPDGNDSPIFDYLLELSKENPELSKKALSMLKDLNKHVYLNSHIEPFVHGGFRCKELKVRHKTDTCRFFFLTEDPHFIVIHGFTKKDERTNKRDIEQAIKNAKSYNDSKVAIELDFNI